eukprot:2569264-Prymnesium_polylepis.1
MFVYFLPSIGWRKWTARALRAVGSSGEPSEGLGRSFSLASDISVPRRALPASASPTAAPICRTRLLCSLFSERKARGQTWHDRRTLFDEGSVHRRVAHVDAVHASPPRVIS